MSTELGIKTIKSSLTEFEQFISSHPVEVKHYVLLQPSNEFYGCKIEYRPQILVCKPPKRAVKPLTDLTPLGFGQ